MQEQFKDYNRAKEVTILSTVDFGFVLECYEAAIKADPQNANAHDSLGKVSYQRQ